MIRTIKLSLLKALPLFAVLLFAFSLRYNTFWLSHWKGDQEHYLALAMKLDHFGFSDYNLRHVDIQTEAFKISPNLEGLIAEVVPGRFGDTGDRGYLLAMLDFFGVVHYNIPLHMIAPGFPTALIVSNRLFGDGRYTVCHRNIGQLVRFIKPPRYIKAQFYAVIVPVFFSLMVMCIVYILGKKFFSYRAGVYASFILCINAIDLLASQRIWADEMVASFVALGVLLSVLAMEKNNYLLALLSGISCGIATLTKQFALVIIGALFCFTVLSMMRKDTPPSKIAAYGIIFFLVFMGFMVCVLPWFVMAFRTYGNPFFLPADAYARTEAIDATGWYTLIKNRPAPFILYTVGMVCISPIFILAYVGLFRFIKSLYNIYKQNISQFDITMVLLYSWFLCFLAYFLTYRGKEQRYLLSAYPALAILSAYMLTRLRVLVLSMLGKNQIILTELFIIFILGLCGWWGIHLGNGAVLSDSSLIIVPF